jgi:hypothetical protein
MPDARSRRLPSDHAIGEATTPLISTSIVSPGSSERE